MIIIKRCVLILLASFAVFASEKQETYADSKVLSDSRIRGNIARFKHAGTEKVMEILAIKPGMTILDIGTGTGQFAYAFAERLRGTGMVFATDINIDCINYVKEEAAKRGLTNLSPVLVRKEGVDGFYSGHNYDLITLFHTNIAGAGADYFSKLRDFLAEDGRLVIIFYENAYPFSSRDFTEDFRGLVGELAREPAHNPFYNNLRESTRALIKQNSSDDEVLKKAVIEDFNSILTDNHFGGNFVDGTGLKMELAFNSKERDFADFLLSAIGDFDRNKKTERIYEIKNARWFNKLLIIQKFRRFLHMERMFPNAYAKKMKNVVEKAGFKLEKEYDDVIPFETILVFTANKKAMGK